MHTPGHLPAIGVQYHGRLIGGRYPALEQTVFCISISHATACMLVLCMSQFIAVHPFASVSLMHQIACWLCAYRSLLPCTSLHRYFSCTRLHVGFAHIAVYCRAPVCIDISHAPDCMLVLRPFAGFTAPVRHKKKSCTEDVEVIYSTSHIFSSIQL